MPRRSTERRAARRSPGEESEKLEQLRRLMTGPERARIAHIEDQLGRSLETVASALPEVVTRATEARAEALGIALEPSVWAAVRALPEKQPQLFTELLAPSIGAAVRRAVTDALAAMLQKFDEVLERSLSMRSVLWRLEARRTHRPFAEVVLLRTLVYRVEQVFLIHASTGLVLQHVAGPGVGVQEPDQVAAMLDAIDSFVREAFRPQPPGVHLGSIQLGDLTVWIDREGPLALAAVVRGVAPRDLADLLRESRERIYLAHQAELARFQSDVAPFAAARPLLESCLRAQRRPPQRRAWLWLLAGAVLIVAVLVQGRMRADQRQRLLSTARAVLARQPGLFITSVRWADGSMQIAGLRDPLAAPPASVLARSGLPPAVLRFAPFYSADPAIALRRARRVLRPPSGVQLELAGGVLRAAGTAPQAWIERARLLAATLPAVDRLDEADLRAAESLTALRAASDALTRLELRFPRGSARVASARRLEQAAALVQQALAAAAAARTGVCIVISGHADPTGSQERNLALARARALTVAGALSERGVPAELLRASGAGVWTGAGDARAARKVTLRVHSGARCQDSR